MYKVPYQRCRYQKNDSNSFPFPLYSNKAEEKKILKKVDAKIIHLINLHRDIVKVCTILHSYHSY